MFYCSQQLCKLKILKIQIIAHSNNCLLIGTLLKVKRTKTSLEKLILAVFIDKNINKENPINFNSTHVLPITAEDNSINYYKKKKNVFIKMD